MTAMPDPEPVARHDYMVDTTVFCWQNQTLRADLVLTLPIALCLAIGLATGHPLLGIWMDKK